MPTKPSSVLEQLLGKVEPDAEAKILRIVDAFGMGKDDPIFLLLLANSSVQVLLEQAPNQLQHTFEFANQKALDRIESYEQAARRGVERQVSEAVNTLIQKAGASKAQVTAKSLVAAGAIALGLLWVGLIGGWGYSQWRQSKTVLDPSGPRQLTLDEAEALKWALSEEGRYAESLMGWNEDLLGGDCQQQVQDLGVTIQMGTQKASSGFCLVWTHPPDEREFFPAQ